MSDTFASRLAARDSHRNLRFYFTISGINQIFHAAEADVPAALIASTRTRLGCVAGWGLDRRDLDIVGRRAKGGALKLKLIDDAAGSLESLFAVRKSRTTFIDSSHTAATTTISVKTDTMAAASDIWVGGETITLGTKSAGDYINSTRGAYGSRAQKLRGGTNNGQAVYTRPPSWVGRIVTMYGYFLDASGSSNTSLQATLGTFEIDTPPKFRKREGSWELSARDRIDGYLSRGLYVGIQPTDVAVTTLQVRDPQIDYMIQSTRTPLAGLFGDRFADTSFLIASPNTSVTASNVNDCGNYCFVRFAAGDDRPIDVVLQGAFVASLGGAFDPTTTGPWFAALANTVQYGDFPPTGQAYPCAFLVDSADSVLMKLLSSVTGDTANGADDVLLGLSPAGSQADAFSWRLGAGILRADLDTTAIQAVGRGVTWGVYLAEPRGAAEAVADFCFQTDSCALTNTAGQLTFKPLTSTSSSIATIDETVVIGGVEVDYDEANVFAHVILDADYSAPRKQFTSRIEVNDNEIADRYPTLEGTLKVQSKSTLFGFYGRADTDLQLPRASITDVEDKLRRWQASENGKGAMYLTLRAHLDLAQLDLGDIVTFDYPEVPDLEGAFLAARPCRVVSVLPLWRDGYVELKLQVLQVVERVSPAATIHAIDVTKTILTLNADFLANAAGQPGNMFGSSIINTPILVWDKSAGTAESHLVVNSTATTITLDSALVFVLSADNDFVTLDQNPSFTDPTTDGFTSEDFLVLQEDDEAVTGYANGDTSRWE